MAALNINWPEVRVVRAEAVDTQPAGAALDPGRYVTLDANAKVVPGNVNGGVLISRSIQANEAVTYVMQGEIYLGDALDHLNANAAVYVQANGTLDDNATGNTRIGYVASVNGDKVLVLD